MNEENARKLLFAVDDILNDVGLKHFLYGGTCLGAIRDKKFVGIDMDIDIGSLMEDFLPLFEKIKDAFKERGMKIDILDHRHSGEWNGGVYAIKFFGYGEHGDFALFLKDGDLRKCPGHLGRYWIIHKREYLENLKEIEFYGRKFFVPEDINGFLTEKYGNWREPHKRFYNISKSRIYDIGLTFGGFDLCHLGHINLLRQAKEKCEKLIVGVSTNERIFQRKKKKPLLSYEDRVYLVSLTGYADIIDKQGIEGKKILVKKYNPAVLFVGDDWTKETFEGSNLCQVIFLPRTKGISSSWYQEHIGGSDG